MSHLSFASRFMQGLCLSSVLIEPALCAQAEPELVARLDRVTTELFTAEHAVPGMAVAVVKGDTLIYSKGFGVADLETKRPVTPDTAFYIASTTKAFTALAVNMLDFQGRMSLDATVASYVPAVHFTPPLSAASITLRDLLGMTHGIDQAGIDPIVLRTAYTGEFTSEQLVSLLSTYKPAKSGCEFAYGNLGYNLAALAMEAKEGKSWKELVKEQVLAPLGMQATTAYASQVPAEQVALPYRYAPGGELQLAAAKQNSNMHAAGGLFSTANDLARFLLAQLNAGRVDGKQVIPAAVIASSHKQHVEQDREYGPFHRHGWSLGYDVGNYADELLVHRFGSFQGYFSHVSFMPEQGVGVVILINQESMGALLADAVSTAIYDELLGKADNATAAKRVAQYKDEVMDMKEAIQKSFASRAKRSQKLPSPLSAYTGNFHNELLGIMRWTLEQGKLHVAMGAAASDVEVYDGDDNQLRVELFGSGSVVTFDIQNGSASKVDLNGLVFVRAE
jgi:CubicO group peptidase (beta-lactamase class C family)